MPCSCEGQEAWLPTCPPHTHTHTVTSELTSQLSQAPTPPWDPTHTIPGRQSPSHHRREDHASYSTQSPKYISSGSQLQGVFRFMAGNNIKAKKALLLQGLAL